MTTEPTMRADEDWADTLPDLVRRRDLRAPPPFPTPPRWRWAFVVDFGLHLAIALVVAVRLDLPFLVTATAAFTLVSFVHRVPLQWWWGATLGRALFGLRCVDKATGAKAAFGGLLKTWLLAGYLVVVSVVIPVLGAAS